jgi:VCBS repeat-containing protein/parallel beta-helix repeat protein
VTTFASRLRGLARNTERNRNSSRPPPSGPGRSVRRLAVETLEDRSLPSTFNVLNTNDGGADSLRQAILDANGSANVGGPDRIAFNIPGAGVHTIAPLSALPAITDPVVIDGYTQPGASPNTRATGSDAILQVELNGNAAGFTTTGLTINAADSLVRGLVINRFNTGLALGSSVGTVIEGNYIGTNAAGTAALANRGSGVFAGPSNIIGGTTAAARNVISGNAIMGVVVASSGTVIEGNYIGTNAAGTAAIGNAQVGVLLTSSASQTTTGGSAVGEGNLISGNAQSGIEVRGGHDNQVRGNYIGTNATGTGAVANLKYGVFLSTGALRNTIGGTTPGAGNVISGNSQLGVHVSASSFNLVQGNLIGTDVSGTAPLGNGTVTPTVVIGGVFLDGTANDNTIGGMTSEARNVISANFQGVAIGGARNLVQGNFVGTGIGGSLPLGNTTSGVTVNNGGRENVIGGTAPGARNVISANQSYGIAIVGSGNLVQGNFIGTDAGGTLDLGNRSSGISIGGFPATDNTIGGTTAGAGNVISGNDVNGVELGRATQNSVQGNRIGVGATGGPLGNARHGVYLIGQGTLVASDNAIGGMTPGAGNSIAYNGGDGVFAEPSATRNALLANSIYANTGLGIDLSPDGRTANDLGDGDAGANNLQNYPVLNAVVSTAGIRVTQGTLNSAAGQQYRVQFFANTTADPSGFGEGESFLGEAMVTTDAAGNAGFTFPLPASVPVGQFITATATDAAGNTSEFSAGLGVSISGEPVNHPPVIVTAGGPYAMTTADATIQLGATVADPDVPVGDTLATFTWSVDLDQDGRPDAGKTFFSGVFTTQPPDGVTPVAVSATVSASVLQAVGISAPGSYPILLSVADSRGGTSSAAAVLDVLPAMPVANPDAYSADEDTNLIVAAPGVLGNDTDPNGYPITAVQVSGPTNGTLVLNADGSFTYAPAANFFGTDSFAYKATDGLSFSNTVTVSLTVNAVNDAPVAGALSVAGAEDTLIPGQIDGSDVDGDPLSFALVTGPQHGTVLLTDYGSFSYQPGADFNGTDTFTVTASDGLLSSAPATVTITVTPVNDPPVNTVPGAQTAAEDVTKVISGLSVADDGAGVLTVTLAVAHGTLTVNNTVAGGLTAAGISGNGTAGVALTGTQAQINATLAAADGLTYLGAPDYSGLDALTMTTTDAGGLSDNDVVAIEVLSAQQQAVLLAAVIADLRADGVLTGGQQIALLNKLGFLSGPNGAYVVRAFVNQVSGLVNAGILTQVQGNTLIDAADTIVASLQ